MGVCAGLDDDEQSDEGGGEGSEPESSEADDGSDGEAGSEAGSEADGEEGGEGSEPECAAGSDGEEGSRTQADGARKAKGRKGSRFVEHQAGHSSGSDGESATEDASDADSDGNLKGFTVPDDEASESNCETDEELEEPPARRRLQRNRTCDAATAAAEARLGRSLEGLKILRIEAQRAQDVVSGEKTLELTGKRCHQTGLVLVGETAKGATAPNCVIGAVTLGDCAAMASEAFEATADRHLALDFAPAREWLKAGTLHAQQLKSAVRFEQAVPYQPASGARKWRSFRAVQPSAVDAKLARIVQQACSVAHGQACVLRELIRLLDAEATTLEETAECEEEEPRSGGRVVGEDDAMDRSEAGTPTGDADMCDASADEGETSGGEAGAESTELAPIPTKHPADAACEQAEAQLRAQGVHEDFELPADGSPVVNPLTGERNLLISPSTATEKAAMRSMMEVERDEGEAARLIEEPSGEDAFGGEGDGAAADGIIADGEGDHGESGGEGTVAATLQPASAAHASTYPDMSAGNDEEASCQQLMREANGGEGDELAVAEKPWAPKDTEELLHAIATMDYGVSQDRSWSKMYPKAIQAYNSVADRYHQSVQKRGQPLHENFWIVKVRFACPACTSRTISRMHISHNLRKP